MKTTFAILFLCLPCLLPSARAQGRTDAAAARRRGVPTPPTGHEFSAAELAAALTHVETSARFTAITELREMVRAGTDISDAVPVLREVAMGRVRFASADVARQIRTRAMDLLIVADTDALAVTLARSLAEGGPDQPRYLEALARIENVSVNLDEDLFKAFRQTIASTPQQQFRQMRYPEGMLAWTIAKLARDRERAGKAVLERMRWEMDKGLYVPEHFLAVRLCADQCAPLLPGLMEAYRDKNTRVAALKTIAALAVHHDDAWDFFSARLQDGFADASNKRYMATAFAHSWVLAPEEVRKRSLPRIATLTTAVPDWQSWRTAGKSLVAPLHSDFDGSDKERDVMAAFRKATGYVPPAPDLGGPRSRRR